MYGRVKRVFPFPSPRFRDLRKFLFFRNRTQVHLLVLWHIMAAYKGGITPGSQAYLDLALSLGGQ